MILFFFLFSTAEMKLVTPRNVRYGNDKTG